MDSPYFLTRQTANLMEDFARELAAGSAVYLLYGEPRVGKTRLLQELWHSRLGDVTVHWIDLAIAADDIADADLSDEIERLFEQAAPGDVIIADHFESTLKKNRHQLFLSWSANGADKQLNLIVASNIEGFNELRLLSQQYQARVQSYQLMPLADDESDAFLGHYLFPDHPLGKLAMPAPLRRQVADAQGVIGNLVEIADHDGSHIETAPLADTESLRGGSRIVAAALMLFVIVLGAGWYFFVEPEPLRVDIPLAQAPKPDAGIGVAAAPTVAEETIEETQPSGSLADDDANAAPAIAPEPVGTAPIDGTAWAEDAGAPTADAATDPAADPADSSPLPVDAASREAPDAAQAGFALAPAPDEAAAVVDQAIGSSATARSFEPDLAEIVAAQVAATTLASVDPEPPPVPATTNGVIDVHNRLMYELERSIDWLSANDNSSGTIQVLLLGFKRFDPVAYFDHVEDLGRRQVDTDQLRIFKTFTGGRIAYSVFYGEYESRQAALRAIDELPEALRKIGPIPRSVGGIWQEIRRLPDEY